MPDETRFGKYELNARLSSGGMGVTWRATQPGKAPVALKLIHAHLAADPDFIGAFLSDAKAAMQLLHPNIATVLDCGITQGTCFVASELVEGHSLAEVMAAARQRGAGALPEALATHIAVDICEALGFAHEGTNESGQAFEIFHRDLTPENVMLSSSGDVKVLDFGLAKTVQTRLRTESGTVYGKYPYFSPEQVRQDQIDARTDLWALGVILYEMLCQHRPYEGELVAVMRAMVKADFPRPTALNPALSKRAEGVILKALAYDREARYRSAKDVSLALTEKSEYPQPQPSDLQWLLDALFGPNAAQYADAVKKRYPPAQSAQMTAPLLSRVPQLRPSGKHARISLIDGDTDVTNTNTAHARSKDTAHTTQDLPIVADSAKQDTASTADDLERILDKRQETAFARPLRPDTARTTNNLAPVGEKSAPTFPQRALKTESARTTGELNGVREKPPPPVPDLAPAPLPVKSQPGVKGPLASPRPQATELNPALFTSQPVLKGPYAGAARPSPEDSDGDRTAQAMAVSELEGPPTGPHRGPPGEAEPTQIPRSAPSGDALLVRGPAASGEDLTSVTDKKPAAPPELPRQQTEEVRTDSAVTPYGEASSGLTKSVLSPVRRRYRNRIILFIATAVGVFATVVLIGSWKANETQDAVPVTVTPVLVTSRPSGVPVSVDGFHAGVTPYEGTLPFGEHLFEISVEGFQPWARKVTLQGSWQVPIDAKLLRDGEAPEPDEPKKPRGAEPDEPSRPDDTDCERHWPTHSFTVKAALHTVVALGKLGMGHADLDPRAGYQVSVNGKLTWKKGRSTSTFLLLLEGDAVPEGQRLTWITKTKHVSGATGLRVFVFDENPDDNDGHVTVGIFKSEFDIPDTVQLTPTMAAMAIAPDERVRLSGLNPAHRYGLSFHNSAAKAGPGMPAQLVCLRETPKDEPITKSTLLLPFTFDGELTGMSAISCFFLDLAANQSSGEVRIDVTDNSEDGR
jgi:serine/threonine protein kinase